MKTKKELNALKQEVETLNKKLHELTEEELAQVTGGDEDFDAYLQQLMEKYPDMMQKGLYNIVNGSGLIETDRPALKGQLPSMQNAVGHNITNVGTEGYSRQQVNTRAISPKYLEK